MIAITPELLELHKRLADIDASVAELGADQAVARIDELLATEAKSEHKVFALWARARIINEHTGVVAAVPAYQASIDLAEDELAVAIRYELGVAWRHAGEAGEAESVLRRTADDAAELAQWGVVARAVEHLSGMASDRGMFPEARTLALEADESWSKTDELAERARGLRRLGELEERHGDIDQAEEAFRKALRLYSAAGESSAVVEVQCQLSNVLVKKGDATQAIEVARSAVDAANESSQESVPAALYALALSLDDDPASWEGAEKTFVRAYEEASFRGQLQLAAQASGDVAGLLVTQKRPEEALVWNERSEGLYNEIGNSRGVMVCARNAARCYELLEDTDAQVFALRKALGTARDAGVAEVIPDLSRHLAEALGTPEAVLDFTVVLLDHVQRELLKEAASGDEFEERSRSLVDGLLESLVNSMEDDLQALNFVIRLLRSTTVRELGVSVALARRALDRWKDLDDPLVAWLRFELAKLMARLGDHDAARSLFLEAYDVAKEFQDANLQVGVAVNLALACQELDLVDEARVAIEETIPIAKTGTEADSLRLNLAVNHMRFWGFTEAEPLLLAVLASSRERNDRALVAVSAANLAALLADTDRPEEAVGYLTLVDENVSEVAVHQRPGLMHLKAYVLEKAGRTEAAAASYDEMARMTDQQQIQLTSPGLQVIFLASRQHLYPRAIDLAVKTDPAKGLYLAEVGRARALAQSIIGPGATHPVPEDMADRLRGRLARTEIAVAYYLTENHLIIWGVSADEVRVTSVDVGGAELEKLIADYRQSLDGDSEDLHSHARLSDLLIVPISGWVTGYKTVYFSPHGLLHNIPFAALGRPARLVQSHEVAVVPALHLLDQKPAWGDSWREKPLIVGDPSLDLPSAREEAEEVARLLAGSTLLIGPDATKERVLAELGEASLLHLASHAGFDPSNSFNSGVVLASPAGGNELLGLPEIVQLKNVPKLIVLSACETRLFALSIADDPVGVAAAFLIAGAETAVASLWRVSDDATAELMRSFYLALETQPPIAALTDAQRRMDSEPNFDASDWAAFTAYTVASSRRVRKRGGISTQHLPNVRAPDSP